MADIEDVITDIGSIVSSVRPGEIMTFKRVEEDYRTIYGKSIPYAQYSYPSLSKLLESFPNHFRVFMTAGGPAVQSNARNNITALIAKERRSKAPKNFQINNRQSSHKVLKTYIAKEKDLPTIILKEITDIVETFTDGLHKDRLMSRYMLKTGHELKYRDFGFANENELFHYLNGRVLILRNDLVCPLTVKGPSIFDILTHLLTAKTGYTLACLQKQVSDLTSANILTLIKDAGRFTLSDVIEDANVRGLLCFDQHFVYGAVSRGSTHNVSAKIGVSTIQVHHIIAPDQFFVEIVSNESMSPRAQLHDKMQRLAPKEPLLAMFVHNRFCSFNYNAQWYRVIVSDVRCDIKAQCLTVRFVDFPIELEHGVEVKLPTDRLRFVPLECESVSEFVYRASLAYVCPQNGRQWSRQSCDIFTSLVTDSSCKYRSFLVDQTSATVSIDIVACTNNGDKFSIFQRLVEMNMAQSIL